MARPFTEEELASMGEWDKKIDRGEIPSWATDPPIVKKSKKHLTEERKAYGKRYYAENKEKWKEYRRRYALEHKEEINKKRQARRSNMSEDKKQKIAAYNKEYRKTHVEYFKEKSKEYYEKFKAEREALCKADSQKKN